MTTHNTRNPLGSTAVKDLLDNAENLDSLINDHNIDVWDDRFGRPRKTWRGIEKQAQLDIAAAVGEGTAAAEGFRNESEQARDAAQEARADAVAAAGAAGPAKFFSTYADFLVGISMVPADGQAEIARDENRNGARTRYSVAGGVPKFEVNLDQGRLDLAKPNGSSLSGFQAGGVGAVVRNMLDKGRDAVSLFDFIPVEEHAAIYAETSTYDCTPDAIRALAAHPCVRAGPGLHRLTSLPIPPGRSLLTTGYATTLHQLPGQPVGTRMIVPMGSDIEIGDMTVRGNIATDKDEQQHAVFIRPSASTGDIRNIKIGNVRAFDIRGDAIYAGQPANAAYKLTNVTIGDVYLDNVFRNGVSIVSGGGMRAGRITGPRVGYCHLLIEPNITSGAAIDIYVEYVKGRVVGVVGPTASDFADGIEFGNLDLNHDHSAQSDPPYTALGDHAHDGLMLRNVKRIKIGQWRVENIPRCALFVITNPGEIGAQLVDIGSLYMRNCSVTDTVYNAFVVATNSKVKIGSLDVDINTAKYAFRGITNLSIGRVVGNFTLLNSGLVNACPGAQIDMATITGSGVPINSSDRVSIYGGAIAGDRLASFSHKCSFQNLTATAASFLFNSGYEDHSIVNSTLNGDYYGAGSGIRNHLNTYRFGQYELWADAKGVLRIKSAKPVSDMDGAPLALKVAAPTSAASAGAPGNFAVSGGYRYDYTGDGTTHSWVRAAVAAW